MRLRTRLWISFVIILVLPLLMIALAGGVFVEYQINVIEKVYGVTINRDFMATTPVQIVNRTAQMLKDQIQEEIEEDVDQFCDLTFLSELDDKVSKESFSIVVRKDGDTIYASEDVRELLPDLPLEDDEDGQSESKLLGERQMFVKQQTFTFSDGESGNLFLITDMSVSLPEMRRFYVELIVLIVLIMAITAGCLTMWIYNSIVKPLGTLKTAAINIKEGNLDFSIEGNSGDEIGQLYDAFEEMRIRLKETTEEKLQADAQNKELISNISHDLKTPITAIKGYVEGLRDGVADTPEKRERYIKTIYTKATDMDRLIDELTFYSRVDSNRIPYAFKKLNVCEYFDDCAEEVEMELSSRNIDFQYSNFCDNDAVIIADAEQLRRVINNIIGNSVKYIDKPKKKINLSVKDEGDFIQVEIEDNGIGIARKDLAYIFDRFYRTDTSRNSSKGGSGIGLSIVRKIIEDHGGKVWATSKEGTGTVMHFVLRKYIE